eukprot:3813531-Rhodomonas_salina.2
MKGTWLSKQAKSPPPFSLLPPRSTILPPPSSLLPPLSSLLPPPFESRFTGGSAVITHGAGSSGIESECARSLGGAEERKEWARIGLGGRGARGDDQVADSSELELQSHWCRGSKEVGRDGDARGELGPCKPEARRLAHPNLSANRIGAEESGFKLLAGVLGSCTALAHPT